MLSVILFLKVVSCNNLAIFNEWNLKSNPYLFRWTSDSENFSEVKAFNNSIGIQIKWSCSTTINDRMYLFGGLPDDGTEIKTVLEITNCGLSDTGILLPFPLAGHACTTKDNSVTMCGSLLNLLSPNCTRFDGKQFHNVSSTAIGHQYGAMVDFGEIVIMGGMNYGEKDYDQVEAYDSDNNKWHSLSPMLEPMRLFSAVSTASEILIFGGFSGKTGLAVKSTYALTDSGWSKRGDLLSARFGHRSIIYEIRPKIISVLHIGGDGTKASKGLLPIERWDLGQTSKDPVMMINSTLILDNYVSFPEIFNVSSKFCT